MCGTTSLHGWDAVLLCIHPLYFSPDSPNTIAGSVAVVLLQCMELFIPSSVVPIGSKCRPSLGVLGSSSKKSFSHEAWADAVTVQNQNTSALKEEYNFASSSCKKDIARAKSEYIARIGERLERLPSGTRASWSLAKAIVWEFL